MIQQFWKARSRREQILIAMALLLGGLGGGALPLIQYHDQLAARASGWQQERLQALGLVQSIREYRGSELAHANPVSPALLANIKASLEAHELKSAVKQLELKDPQHVVLSIKSVDFLSLIEWLKSVHADLQVQVSQADLSASEKNGVVNAELILEVLSH